MEISPAPLIYLLIFVGVVVLVEGIYLTVFGRSISLDRKVNRRLALLEKGQSRTQVLDQLRKEMDQHASARGIPLYALLADRAQKANIAFSPGQIILIMLAVSGVAFAALTLATEAAAGLRAAMAVAMGVGGVTVWINRRAAKRLSLIEEQLPDAIDLMVRSLRVGHPFSSAVSIVAREVADPLGSEFGVIADEAAYGRDMGEALKAMAERIGMQDLRFLAVAVTIQQNSGGNLAEILHGLSQVIRARFRLFRRVRAITAEAKWSGMFLSAFPILALLGINMVDPNYFDEARETSAFIPAAIVVGVFLVVNVLYMRAMVNIRV